MGKKRVLAGLLVGAVIAREDASPSDLRRYLAAEGDVRQDPTILEEVVLLFEAHGVRSVVMVDRRHGVGGHGLDAYPFVRLHQASAFYGVASTLLGDGRIQHNGPEAGLRERSTARHAPCVVRRRIAGTRPAPGSTPTRSPSCRADSTAA